ncbi:hypothetical protein JCM10450v2_006028 [Rhodotorula kratochvilovae]
MADEDGAGRDDSRDLFSTLPLDILLLIFKYLSPGAVLALSRTSKPLRRLLLNERHGRSFWLAARRTVGWPNLQVPLSEPAYAHIKTKLAGLGYQPNDYDEHMVFDIPWWTAWQDDIPDTASESSSSASSSGSSASAVSFDLAEEDRKMAASLTDFFHSHEPLGEKEWEHVEWFVVDYVAACRLQRRVFRRIEHLDNVCLLRNETLQAASTEARELFPCLGAFCMLHIIQPLWIPHNAAPDLSTWPALSLRLAPLHRLLRALTADGYALPAHFAAALASCPDSPFVSSDWHLGPSPFFSALPPAAVARLLSSAHALFRCAICAIHLPLPALHAHLRDPSAHAHLPAQPLAFNPLAGCAPQPRAAASACALPRKEFREAATRMLERAGRDLWTRDAELKSEGRAFRAWVREREGDLREVDGLRDWEWITSGKTADELQETARKLSCGGDREIVRLELVAPAKRAARGCGEAERAGL